jgi:hypothetical protein
MNWLKLAETALAFAVVVAAAWLGLWWVELVVCVEQLEGGLKHVLPSAR